MLPDLDFWRAAQIMVKRYCGGAATEAAMRADGFLDQGIIDDQRLWMRIMQAIEGLQHTGRRHGKAGHRTVVDP